MIGAWCFADHYGPHDVRTAGRGMDVPPHPHTGLQTVSWLFEGLIEHRDSAGVHAMVRPGELNLMTAGAGICHSEVSTPETTILHGVQLAGRPTRRRHPDTGTRLRALRATAPARRRRHLWVFLGELAGSQSPVHTFTPLLGAQIDLDPDAALTLDVERGIRTRRPARPGRDRGGRHRAGRRRPGLPGAGCARSSGWPTAATDRRGRSCSAGRRFPRSW